jgi:hypothetical protein
MMRTKIILARPEGLIRLLLHYSLKRYDAASYIMFWSQQNNHLIKNNYYPIKNICYNLGMNKLSETNPNLRDKNIVQISNSKSTRTSCGVEGIVSHSSIVVNIKPKSSETNKIFKKIQSRLQG